MPTDTATPTGLMTIGAFSQATRLSLKALRLYDQLGLLPPARVDEATGYRYYAPEQVEAARLVFLLRQLGMPLQKIAAVLGARGGDAVRVVHDYWLGVERDVGVRRQLLARVMARLREEVEVMHEVKVREVPERKLLGIEERTLADRLPEVIGANGDAIFRHARAMGVRLDGPMLVVYHGAVSMDADGPVEVCVPVSGPVEPFGKARVRLEPAGREAYARIRKRDVVFPKILEAYDSVEAWLRENGKRPAGPPREVYLAPWDELGDDDPACDVAFPFA